MTHLPRVRIPVVGSKIDVLDWNQAVQQISQWSRRHESRVVCVCNVHSVVTARKDIAFAKVIRESDMATPDGAPVSWMLNRLGARNQQRINGPDLMWKYCAHAALTGDSIYLYGGSVDTLAKLQNRLNGAYPDLQIVGAYSPPFRPLTEAEDVAVVEAINLSGAGVVWVGLGCPKQEIWMHEHRGKINAVMIGVGAAFDYHAGTIQRAPLWMQRNGLEWLHRLVSEPRRLWKRYLVTNSLFIWYSTLQLLTSKAESGQV